MDADSSALECPSCRQPFSLSDDEDTQDAIPPLTGSLEPSQVRQHVGRFHLVNRLGAGGAGEVWLARDTKSGYQVVIKLGRRGDGRDDKRYEQFCHEAAIGSQLKHPNIVRVLEAGIDDSCPYLVSEHVQGHTLSRWLLSRKPSPHQAAALCIKIADALEHAHVHGVIHRDLKPSNIILDSNQEPHLFDFGIALDLKHDRVGSHYMIGTPAYMAPEQLDSSVGVIDCRTDVYALGLILYELLTHNRPFSGQYDRDQSTPTTHHNPAIPAQLDAICMRCLNRQPENRFASAGELSRELTRFLAVDPGQDTELSLPVEQEDASDQSPQVRQLTAYNRYLESKVSEYKQKMVAMNAEHDLYQSLVESLPIGIFRKDLEKRIVYANDEYCSIVARPFEEVKGKSADELFDPDLAARQQADDAQVIATGRVLESKESLVKDGDVTTFEVVRSAVHNFDRSVGGVQGMMWDVSAHAKGEAALRHAKQKADAASQAKTNFLRNMSHEIRQPLTSIIGMVDLLLGEDGLSSRQNEHAMHIRQAGKSLLDLINDILDIAKIEAGKMEIDCSVFDLRSVLENVHVMFEDRARLKNIQLDCLVDPNVPARLSGDAIRLRQVLMNLVGNAIKFTDRGAVRVNARANSVDSDHVDVLFEVRDTGPGIPHDKMDTIFIPFEQLDTSASRKYGGTGLGLAIARKLVRLMGGEMQVYSKFGEWSVFQFNVTLRPCNEQAIEDAPDSDTPIEQNRIERSLSILVVDDVPTNQTIVQQILEQCGHTVTPASCGNEALRLCGEQDFDLVLMDVQMSGMDGIEATKLIRREEEAKRKQRVPIIALTAYAMKEDRDHCLASGMDGYVTKPYDWKVLFQEMSQVVDTGSDQPRTPSAQPLSDVNEDSLEVLLQIFLEISPGYLQSVRDAVTLADDTALQHSSHRLKGALMNLSNVLRTDISVESVVEIESLARQGRSADAAEHYQKLTAQMEQLHGELRARLGDEQA